MTHNLRDFASPLLAKRRVTVMAPGVYLDALHRRWPGRSLLVAEECRLKLKQPPYALIQYANVLRNLGCQQLPMALLQRGGLASSR